MDKKTEKKIEEKVGKKLGKEIKKEVEKEVKDEVKKRLHNRIYERTMSSAVKFKGEFKNQIVIAVSAALGFLIALSWRTPIQKAVDGLIVQMGLSGEAVYIEFLSALVITLIAVLILMWMSKWKIEEG